MSTRLIAVSDDTRRAIDAEFLTIDRLPFRVGRDSRWERTRPTPDTERRTGTVGQVNDLYLFEDPLAPFHHVSREHFLIDAEDGLFYLEDRRSVCGTIVDGTTVGGDRVGGRIELRDQDLIVAGTMASPYVFKFVVDPPPSMKRPPRQRVIGPYIDVVPDGGQSPPARRVGDWGFGTKPER
jgi:hypothetical protein